MRHGFVFGVLLCPASQAVGGPIVDISTPTRVEYFQEGSYHFSIPAGEAETVDGMINAEETVSCVVPGVPGGVSGKVEVEAWAVSGGPVFVDALLTARSFAWSGGAYLSEMYRPVPLLGPDADPSAALHLSHQQGNTTACGELGYVSATLNSIFAVSFVNTGSEPALLRVNFEHIATLSGFARIPEPGTAAMFAVAASLLAARCFRQLFRFRVR